MPTPQNSQTLTTTFVFFWVWSSAYILTQQITSMPLVTVNFQSKWGSVSTTLLKIYPNACFLWHFFSRRSQVLLWYLIQLLVYYAPTVLVRFLCNFVYSSIRKDYLKYGCFKSKQWYSKIINKIFRKINVLLICTELKKTWSFQGKKKSWELY